MSTFNFRQTGNKKDLKRGIIPIFQLRLKLHPTTDGVFLLKIKITKPGSKQDFDDCDKDQPEKKINT